MATENPTDLNRILQRIADAAAKADRLATASEAWGDVDEQTDALLDSLQETLRRIGWMADLAAVRAGGEPWRSVNAEEWLLPALGE